jgi:hypothetical protein
MKCPLRQLCLERLNGGAPEHRTARTWHVRVGVLLSVTGAVLLMLSTEQQLSLVVMTGHLKWNACACEIPTCEQGCSFAVPF